MSQIRLRGDRVSLDEPVLVEGFPGVGLVGKIATDHLIDQLEMDYYASVHCEGLPRVGIYRQGAQHLQPPVRIYASQAQDLLAIQSDIPIAAQAIDAIVGCLTGWIDDYDATSLFLSGLPAEREGTPALFGVATGDGAALLEAHDIDVPPEDGVVSGPTGALLNRATQSGTDSLGLVVECNPQFPDPEAASVLLERAIGPVADVNVDVSKLIDRATEIQEQRSAFAERMQEVGEVESTQAQPLRMYQ